MISDMQVYIYISNYYKLLKKLFRLNNQIKMRYFEIYTLTIIIYLKKHNIYFLYFNKHIQKV